MRLPFKILSGLFLSGLLFAAAANNWNSWQSLQPWRNNYIARTGSVPPPDAPSDIAGTQTEKDEADLTWTDNSSNEVNFVLERNDDGAGWVEIDTPAADATTYTDTGLDGGVQYQWRIKATGAGGDSAYATSAALDMLYVYGYPGFGSAANSGTPVAQWLLDESSGNIVDEVAAQSVTQAGSPTYSQTIAGDWAGVSPGILITPATGSFRVVATPAALAPGTSDFTLEAVATCTDTAAYRYIYDTGANSFGTGGIAAYFDDVDNLWFQAMQSPGNGWSVNFGTVTGIDPFDGNPHKYRFTNDRDGNAESFVDSVTQGTSSIAAHSAKNIGITDVAVGNTVGVARLNGKLFELRQSHSLTANSGGPGGG